MYGRGNERLSTTNARMAFQRDERFGAKRRIPRTIQNIAVWSWNQFDTSLGKCCHLEMVRPRCSTRSIGFIARTFPDSCTVDVFGALHCTIPRVMRSKWRPFHHSTRMGQMPRIERGKCDDNSFISTLKWFIPRLNVFIWWFVILFRRAIWNTDAKKSEKPTNRMNRSKIVQFNWMKWRVSIWIGLESILNVYILKSKNKVSYPWPKNPSFFMFIFAWVVLHIQNSKSTFLFILSCMFLALLNICWNPFCGNFIPVSKQRRQNC